jgi:hypothetical protein
LEGVDGKFSQMFTKVLSLVEELAKLPSTEPIQKPKHAFNAADSKAEKTDRFLAKFVK